MEKNSSVEIKKIITPLTKEVAASLAAGDNVTISGYIYSARDMAHKRLCKAIEKGLSLPFELEGAVLYYLGPTEPRPGAVIGSAGPTTASRMDGFTPMLLENGVRGSIGKGYRSDKVRLAIKECGAVHFAAIGGAGALLSKHIVTSEIVAYEDLQTEAIRKMKVVDLPLIVAYDCAGRSVYGCEEKI